MNCVVGLRLAQRGANPVISCDQSCAASQDPHSKRQDMDPGRETRHCIVIPGLDRELKDRSSSSLLSPVARICLAPYRNRPRRRRRRPCFGWYERKSRPLAFSIHPPPLHPTKLPRSTADDEDDDDEEHEEWAKQIPKQGTNVRRANLADPSGSSY
jgi:hypothetical protein